VARGVDTEGVKLEGVLQPREPVQQHLLHLGLLRRKVRQAGQAAALAAKVVGVAVQAEYLAAVAAMEVPARAGRQGAGPAVKYVPCCAAQSSAY
jgi:hypothetical protein